MCVLWFKQLSYLIFSVLVVMVANHAILILDRVRCKGFLHIFFIYIRIEFHLFFTDMLLKWRVARTTVVGFGFVTYDVCQFCSLQRVLVYYVTD